MKHFVCVCRRSVSLDPALQDTFMHVPIQGVLESMDIEVQKSVVRWKLKEAGYDVVGGILSIVEERFTQFPAIGEPNSARTGAVI